MKNAKAFTLVELMVTVAVLAVFVTVAVPSFYTLIRNNRMVGYTNELMSAIATARTEAIKRGVTVVLCSSDDGASCRTTATASWEDGWIVFADTDGDGAVDTGELVRSQPALPAITVRSNLTTAGRLAYRGDGFKSNTEEGTFSVCDDRGASAARAIAISPTGRAAPAIDTDNDGTVNHSISGSTGNISCP